MKKLFFVVQNYHGHAKVFFFVSKFIMIAYFILFDF